MRSLLPLAFVFALASVARPAPAPEETKEAARIEKAGGDVTIDESSSEPARLRVTFKKLDEKSAAAVKGSKRIAALTVEDASGTTDRTLATIGTLTNLRELSLFKSGMTNAGMSHLKGLKELRKLHLVDAKVYDSGVAALKGNPKLAELDLSGTMITNAAAATFKTLTGLRLLAVNKTKFGDAGVAQLKELKDLKKLEAIASDVTEKGAMVLEAGNKAVRVRR
jgi:hypothetical protein